MASKELGDVQILVALSKAKALLYSLHERLDEIQGVIFAESQATETQDALAEELSEAAKFSAVGVEGGARILPMSGVRPASVRSASPATEVPRRPGH